MSWHLAAWWVAAVLVCWCVGAYNRLVRLRQASAGAFRELALVLAERHRLIGEWLAATQPSPAVTGDVATAWQAVDAACRQSQAAADHAAAWPTAAAPLASLAMAEQVLRSALAQWAPAAPASDASSPQAGALAAAVAAIDGSWNAARDRFNAASAVYNQAARQFPTRLVARLFGFRPAGHL